MALKLTACSAAPKWPTIQTCELADFLQTYSLTTLCLILNSLNNGHNQQFVVRGLKHGNVEVKLLLPPVLPCHVSVSVLLFCAELCVKGGKVGGSTPPADLISAAHRC